MKSFQVKVAVITGAGSGIGRELDKQLAGQDTGLALCAVNDAGLTETTELLKEKRVPVHTYIADVADRPQMYALDEEVTADFDQVDLLFNNAGVTLKPGYFDTIPDRHRGPAAKNCPS